MLDYVFLSVSNLDRSVAFYTAALTPLGITTRVDYDGKDGSPGHPDPDGYSVEFVFKSWQHNAT
jgi:hypothetical protein